MRPSPSRATGQEWKGTTATTDLPDKQSVARFGSGVSFISARQRAKSPAHKHWFRETIQVVEIIAPIVHFRFSEICDLSCAIPPRQEGRTRRHERGAGCDGREGIVGRAMHFADGEVVWSLSQDRQVIDPQRKRPSRFG